jgi:hypothetical protein
MEQELFQQVFFVFISNYSRADCGAAGENLRREMAINESRKTRCKWVTNKDNISPELPQNDSAFFQSIRQSSRCTSAQLSANK